MKKAQFLSALRASLVIAGTVLATTGHGDNAVTPEIIGSVTTLAGVIWGLFSARKKAVQIDQLAALAADPAPTPRDVVEAIVGKKGDYYSG